MMRAPRWVAAVGVAVGTGVVLALGPTVGGSSGTPLPVAASAPALPAGATGATLSFVDAASGVVEVVRHWPAAPADVAVVPFVPYFWDGCPGDGAIMMLLTGPPTAGALGRRVAAVLEAGGVRAGSTSDALARIIASLRTPGSPAVESLKTIAPWVSDLATYEREGYAVFLFVRWTGMACAVTLRAVPEGYGIPYVR